MGFDFTYHPRLVYYTICHFFEEKKRRFELKKKYQGQYRELKRKNPKTVYLMMTPDHENLGDHAIALAEEKFFRAHGIDYVEITGNELELLQKYNLLSLPDGCPIVMQGGGYLGTLWQRSEELLRALIQANPRSGIVLLPNTIYYEQTPQGREFFEHSKVVYGKHPDLHLYAREKTSFQTMSNAYSNVALMPDMVLSLNYSNQNLMRSGCILSLRQDCEKTRTESEEACIREQAKKLFGADVRDSDMVRAYCIPVSQRHAELDRKFAEFGSAKLVITDRLHGMIFCAITGTPCILLDSKSPKVRGCYEWVKDLSYIKFVESAEKIAETYRGIPQQKYAYDNSSLMPYFEDLARSLEDIFHWR